MLPVRPAIAKKATPARSLPDRTEQYRERLEEWASQIAVPRDWNWEEFWAVALLSNPRIPGLTRGFIERWFDLIERGTSLVDDRRARAVISDRERMTKGSQARLHNRRALELWGGSSGAAQLSFRWPVVERILNDILKGVSKGKVVNARA